VSSFSESGSGSSRPALSRLISLDSSRFADEYWGQQPLLSTGAHLPGGFDDLFSLEAADELISHRAIRTPFVRMANEGTLLDSGRYTGSGGFGAEVSDQLDSAKALVEFAAGSTIVLQGLHRTWAPIADFTRELARELAAPSQVNAYITPASSRGFDPHYDVHDVFVIQVHGEKHWTIHPPVHEHPLRDQPWSQRSAEVAARAKETPAIDATFRPGDVLYLPRGWIHSAAALGGTSIHLTIGVAAYTRWDVVQQLLARVTDSAALRSPMPLGMDFSDLAALGPEIDATVAALAAALGDADRGSASAALARRLATSSRSEPVSALATVEALATIDAATPVAWRRGVPTGIAVDGERVTIALSDRTITLPAEAGEAVRALASGAELTPAELPGLDAASALVIVRRLVREAVLVLR
jgi:lysine-specific demethylase/histidyl-hydroxylase NO66